MIYIYIYIYACFVCVVVIQIFILITNPLTSVIKHMPKCMDFRHVII